MSRNFCREIPNGFSNFWALVINKRLLVQPCPLQTVVIWVTVWVSGFLSKSALTILATKQRKVPKPWWFRNFYGASVLIGLFENISITNGFLDFRASNFLVFTSQNTPKTALPPRRAFQYSLMIQSSVAKVAEYFPLSFLGAIVNAVALFLYQKGWKFSISFPRGQRTERRPYPFSLGNLRGF